MSVPPALGVSNVLYGMFVAPREQAPVSVEPQHHEDSPTLATGECSWDRWGGDWERAEGGHTAGRSRDGGSSNMGAEPKRPIGTTVALLRVMEQTLPYPEDPPAVASMVTGYSSRHFDSAVPLGPRCLGLAAHHCTSPATSIVDVQRDFS